MSLPRKRFVSYQEGAELYSMEKADVIRIAKDAGATYRIGKTTLVNIDVFEEYIACSTIEEFKKVVGVLDVATKVQVLEELKKIFMFIEGRIV